MTEADKQLKFNPLKGTNNLYLFAYDKAGNITQHTIQFVNSTGINEIFGLDDLISIFPNPASDKFVINFNNSKENFSLVILNIIGQVILSKKINTASNTEQVDLSGQPAGVYFVKLQTTDNTVVKKIIKK